MKSKQPRGAMNPRLGNAIPRTIIHVISCIVAAAGSLAQLPTPEDRPATQSSDEGSQQGPTTRAVERPGAALPRIGLASMPASRPAGAGPAAFQPGVRIDWKAREVRVDGLVSITAEPVEFIACFEGKEHESVVLLRAAAAHVYMAMGLIGLEPGEPPTWDDNAEKVTPAKGELISVEFEWRDGETLRRAAWTDWVREVTYGRTPIPRPMIFAGSRVRRDGVLWADVSGAGAALVQMPECLISVSRVLSDLEGDLWAIANTAALPPPGTPVEMIVKAAEAPAVEATLDFRGDLRLAGGRYCSVADFADLVDLRRRQKPEDVALVRVDGAMPSDVERLKRGLKAAGLGEGAVRVEW